MAKFKFSLSLLILVVNIAIGIVIAQKRNFWGDEVNALAIRFKG